MATVVVAAAAEVLVGITKLVVADGIDAAIAISISILLIVYWESRGLENSLSTLGTTRLQSGSCAAQTSDSVPCTKEVLEDKCVEQYTFISYYMSQIILKTPQTHAKAGGPGRSNTPKASEGK
jgi:hypothetical protein